MVKRPHRQHDGYHINGKVYPSLVGSRKMVYTYGTAYKTRGNLTKNDLMMNKSGEIVSKKKHITAKRDNRLVKHGYGTKKGKFGWVKIGSKGSRKSRRSMRGGSGAAAPAAPAPSADVVPATSSNVFKSGPSSV